MAWTEYTWDAVEGYLWDGKVFIPKAFDPVTEAARVFLAPTGGYASVPAMVQGDPGPAPTLDTVAVTEIDYDAPAAEATWTETSPDVYQLNLQVRQGDPGAAGTMTILDATDLTAAPTPNWLLAVNSDGDGVEETPSPVGGMWWPASIISTTSNDGSNRTLSSVTIPAQPFAWRPRVTGQCVITPTGANMRVDLLARINTAASGNICARGFGLAGATENIILVGGPPSGSASDYLTINANTGPTVIYLRAEQQSGSDSFSTTGSTSSFCVEVAPVPYVTPGS